MGYTHYYSRPAALGMDRFTAFSKDADRRLSAVAEQGIALAGPMGRPDTVPEANPNHVAFNGAGDEGHEGFLLECIYKPYTTQQPDDRYDDGIERHFDCCKTARKPYDLAVTAVLIAAKRHFGTDILVSSDGEGSEWDPARDLCQDALGYGNGFVLDRTS